MLDDEPPGWDRSLREVALVALQASVLTRRIYLPAAGPDDLRPEQWQMLLALALIDTGPYELSAASVESIAIQLSLDLELAHELLHSLLKKELVVADVEEDEVAGFRLSRRSWDATRTYAERAGRFLPGWPPDRRLHEPDD